MKKHKKSSPCIGFCSTTYGDLICRGCYRTVDEVLQWRQKTAQEQQQYYNRIAAQIRGVLPDYWIITDSPHLREALAEQGGLYWPPEPDTFCIYFTFFQLLQSGINPFLSYSSCIKWNTPPVPLAELTRIVSREIYVSNENLL